MAVAECSVGLMAEAQASLQGYTTEEKWLLSRHPVGAVRSPARDGAAGVPSPRRACFSMESCQIPSDLHVFHLWVILVLG